MDLFPYQISTGFYRLFLLNLDWYFFVINMFFLKKENSSWEIAINNVCKKINKKYVYSWTLKLNNSRIMFCSIKIFLLVVHLKITMILNYIFSRGRLAQLGKCPLTALAIKVQVSRCSQLLLVQSIGVSILSLARWLYLNKNLPNYVF